jgi:hypothetical protein
MAVCGKRGLPLTMFEAKTCSHVFLDLNAGYAPLNPDSDYVQVSWDASARNEIIIDLKQSCGGPASETTGSDLEDDAEVSFDDSFCQNKLELEGPDSPKSCSSLDALRSPSEAYFDGDDCEELSDPLDGDEPSSPLDWRDSEEPSEPSGTIEVLATSLPLMPPVWISSLPAPIPMAAAGRARKSSGTQRKGQAMDPNALRNRVWELSCQESTCWDVQRTLEVVHPAIAECLAREFQGFVWDAIESPHANHVVQKCITVLKFVPDWLLYEVLSWGPQGIEDMAKHKFGCRIFLRLIEHCWEGYKQCLAAPLMANVVGLSKDKYANFCIQYIIEHGTSEHRSEILASVIAEATSLAKESGKDHFAADVVAKALKHGFLEQCLELAEALLGQVVDMSFTRFGKDIVIEMLRLPQVSERVRGVLRCSKFQQMQDNRYSKEVKEELRQ